MYSKRWEQSENRDMSVKIGDLFQAAHSCCCFPDEGEKRAITVVSSCSGDEELPSLPHWWTTGA